ncbi:hypothetical protein ASPFODRAFT_621712 [Aspergillus luchuensis CBS 106.47]|uniref:Uncharacterized protein n=1 Tax=Aspergillus luchuensis (strain CBS 106.47) TaxID=1137211 RepID=A0A1M3TFS8_ASPLC|nr:hypothetical protein ASPFODRAFT_621712 [Aspergillus luchuensis CBS 106.47]
MPSQRNDRSELSFARRGRPLNLGNPRLEGKRRDLAGRSQGKCGHREEAHAEMRDARMVIGFTTAYISGGERERRDRTIKQVVAIDCTQIAESWGGRGGRRRSKRGGRPKRESLETSGGRDKVHTSDPSWSQRRLARFSQQQLE